LSYRGGFSDIEVIRKAYELGWPVNIVYGSTETSSFVTALIKDEIIFNKIPLDGLFPLIIFLFLTMKEMS